MTFGAGEDQPQLRSSGVRSNGVVVLSGPPCSGKSAVGRLIESDWSSTMRHHLEVDALFDMLLPESDRNAADRMLAYEAAHAVAAVLLDRGRVPVLQCTYGRRRQRASLVQALVAYPWAPVWVVEFSVAPEEAVMRFRRSPSHQATDLTEQLVSDHARRFPFSDGALRLDSVAASSAELAGQVSTWLSGQPKSINRERWVAAGRA